MMLGAAKIDWASSFCGRMADQKAWENTIPMFFVQK